MIEMETQGRLMRALRAARGWNIKLAASRLLVAMAITIVGGTLPVPAGAIEVDTRCYILFPDRDFESSAILRNRAVSNLGPIQTVVHSPGGCVLECEPTQPGGGVFFFPSYAELDDCFTEPIFQFTPGYVFDSAPAPTVIAALEELEQEALSAVIALYQLPATDISRNGHVFGYGRGAMRSWLLARILEIAQKPAAERTPAEQSIVWYYAQEVKHLRVSAVQFAISEYDRWHAAPCAFTPPEGFSYSPGPACGGGSLIGLFTDVRPPSKDEFISYGTVEVRRKLLDADAMDAAVETSRFAQFLVGLVVAAGGTVILAGLISAAAVTSMVAIAVVLFPFQAGIISASAAFSAAVAHAFALAGGVIGIIFITVFIAVLQGFFVFSDAAIRTDLVAALQEAQSTPFELREIVATDEGKQELFDVFMLSTLPDHRATGDVLPAPDRSLQLTRTDGSITLIRNKIEYVGWDGALWEAKLAAGWFMPRQKISDEEVLSLFIEYKGCDGQNWNAARFGNRFLTVRNEANPETQSAVADEICFRFHDGTHWRARIIADTTPPQIAGQVSGTKGDDDWYVSNVNVQWTVADDESDIFWRSGCAQRVVTTDGEKSFTCRAESDGGQSAATVAFKRDATPPTISGSLSGLNAAGWSNSSVNVTFQCSDALSGVESCSPNQTVSSEGQNQSVIGSARDKAGNTAQTTVSGINIDKTRPWIAGITQPPPNQNFWNNTDVTLTCACNDALSGIAECSPASVVFSTESSNHGIECHAVDKAGNSRSFEVSGIAIDKTPPTVFTTFVPIPNRYGWNNSNVTVTCQCSDALSGIATCSDAPVVFTTESSDHRIDCHATDRAGNSTFTQVTDIAVDKTPPTVDVTRSPEPNAEGWNNTDVTATCLCSDALSGIRACSDDPVVFSTEGSNLQITCTATDRADNTTSMQVSDINIDKTPPAVTVSVPPDTVPTYLLNEVVLADWAASDTLSGLASAVGSAESGQAIDTSRIGTHVFEVTAYDRAGNLTQVQRSYEVIDSVAAFEFTVERAMLSTWRPSPRDNGFLVLRGSLHDPSPDGTFLARVLEEGFELSVQDVNSTFDVTVPLGGCRLRPQRGLFCGYNSPWQVRISIVPADRRDPSPSEYELRVNVRRLPDSLTGTPVRGANPIHGPVSVSLRRGEASTSVSLSDCQQRGHGTLLCARSD